MKILISPSKTKSFKKENIIKNSKHIFQEKNDFLINYLKSKDENFYKRIYKKDELAQKYAEIYKNFSKLDEYIAIDTYNGLVFKNLDFKNIKNKKYLEENLLIFSGLYGLLKPYDGIRDYRLDFNDKLDFSLYKFYEESINEYLKNEDIIINLASNEYSKILKLNNIFTIEFYKLNKNNIFVKQSTHSKEYRGKFLKYLIEHKINNIDDIKNIRIDNLIYNEEQSNENVLKFYEK